MKASTFFKVGVVYVLTLFLALMASFFVLPKPAHALEWALYEADGVAVVLFDEACTFDALKDYLTSSADSPPTSVLAASVSYQGSTFPACYYRDGDKVVLADMTGNAGFIMLSLFRRQSV